MKKEKDKFAGSDPKAGSTIKGTGFDWKKERRIPWDFWNHNIHPILGFVWQQPAINSHKLLNKNELDSY